MCMCGIVGTISAEPVATDIYEGLISLQHRGQDACGITTYGDQFHTVRGLGLVREVVREKQIGFLQGCAGIGHVRYSTVGGGTYEDTQPFVAQSPYGIALAHNGNLYNFWELKKELFEKEFRYINSNCDAEVILHVFADALRSLQGLGSFFDQICSAVAQVHRRARGAYSTVAVIAGKGLVAFRDPHGIRPMVWGKRSGGLAPDDHIFTSETTSFQILGYELERDIAPGEVVFVEFDGTVHTRVVEQREFRPCIFEYVYFARPDAFINGVSVHRARLRMGQNLARKIRRLYPELPIDIVIPAPTSANPSALACAHELGVRYSEGMVKNQFIGRTFIMPGQGVRKKANKYKLSVVDQEVRNKNVLVVDDSIVRGNVSRHIVQLMRSHGARHVYFASASPALRYPDLYGIDLPTREEYIAHNRSEEEVRAEIGADVLVYQGLEDLVEAVIRRGQLQFRRPHTAFFDGKYPTEDVTDGVLDAVEQRRIEERRTC